MEWILVSDRKPEKKKQVLVSTPRGYHVAWINHFDQWWREGTQEEWFPVVGVTKWMPIPHEDHDQSS